MLDDSLLYLNPYQHKRHPQRAVVVVVVVVLIAAIEINFMSRPSNGPVAIITQDTA